MILVLKQLMGSQILFRVQGLDLGTVLINSVSLAGYLGKSFTGREREEISNPSSRLHCRENCDLTHYPFSALVCAQIEDGPGILRYESLSFGGPIIKVVNGNAVISSTSFSL